MFMAELDEFKTKLRELMNLKKELAPGTGGAGVVLFQEEGEENKDQDMADLEKLDQELSADESNPEDAPEENQDNTDTEPSDETSDTTEEPQTEPEQAPPQNNQNDNQKVQEMFKDTGSPEVDYSLSNENNVRLYKFKFTYAGINVDELMQNDQEKKSGLSRKELESRLSPEQLHYYNEKWKKLREKFPQIPQREKNVAIHNANIMLLINDKDGQEIPLPEEKKLEAYKKINKMMETKFGAEWQDLPEALNFLKNIKINFSNDRPVRHNLLSVKVLQEKDKIKDIPLIPFNKIYVEVPSSVQGFLRISQDSGIYNGSSIYQALSSDFKEADRTLGTMDAIIRGTPEETDEQDTGNEDTGGDTGGDGGGMDLGGGSGDLGDMGGDLGGDGDTTDTTGDTGDTGEDTGDETDTNTDNAL
jgi:hypothetical protein